MIILIDAALAFCIVASLLHVASAAVVLGRVCRNRTAPSPTMNVAVSIVRPLCGIENFSELTLSSTFQLDYSRYEVVFCVANRSDSVIPLVRRLIDEYPHIPSRLLIGNDRISDNPKLNNVVKGWDAAEHAWLVMADSNVLMPTDYLHRLLGTWRRDTGLVSSPAVGCCPDGPWAELECAFLNTYQVRWQCFADAIGIRF
jgi:ceramide glucosyltransferase